MQNRKNQLIVLLWSVIVVLVIGSGIGGYILVRHANDVDQTNTELMGNNESLKRQVDQAKALLKTTPPPSASPLATPETTPEPTPQESPTTINEP